MLPSLRIQPEPSTLHINAIAKNAHIRLFISCRILNWFGQQDHIGLSHVEDRVVVVVVVDNKALCAAAGDL